MKSETDSPSRRTVLAAGAAAIGATAVAVPIPAVAGDDPIYAAIERHRAALARLNECCHLTDQVAAKGEGRVITNEDRAVYECADEAEEAAMYELALTPPTSVTGLVAQLQYVKALDEPEKFFGDFVEALLASPLLNGEARS